MLKVLTFCSIFVAGLAIAGCTAVPESAYSPSPGSTGSTLYEGIDTYHFPITTDSASAQQWFDQGLLLVYGFNHGEAIRSFTEAAARDPEAAMPWWGISISHGMNINDRVVTEDRWKAGYEAAQHALALLDDETELERALVEAVATRYAWPAPPEQRPYDEAYADAMTDVYAQFTSNPDVAALYAESLMNLQPWDYWTKDGQPKGNTETFLSVIEGVLAAHPMHPQACHLYIHAMEAGPNPARAELAADHLLHRVPGAGHLVHMSSHLYARVGRYADASDSNALAVAADREYFEHGTDPGMYWLYYAHNLHFLTYAAMMEGRYDTAMEAARDLQVALPDEAVRDLAWLIEGIIPTTYHVMIRFGKWQEILEEPLPPEHLLVSRAVHYYARAIALSAMGRTDEAREEAAMFEAAAAKVPGDWYQFNNLMSDVFPIARAMMEGEIAFREGRLDDAWAALRRGIEAEDRLIYDEPPAWMIPVRHAMGALLMSADKYAEAEAIYREDQTIHPGNGWSLLGLKQALEAQGELAEAATITTKLEFAWQRVMDRPTSSCYCQPDVGDTPL